MTVSRTHPFADHPIAELARERILVLDGAMGTEIQTLDLEEHHFRADRFEDHTHDLRGNNDLLVLTQPDAMRDIHLRYLLAGADIVETNTFSGTRIAQGDYGTHDIIVELNLAAVRVARGGRGGGAGPRWSQAVRRRSRRTDQRDALDLATGRGPRLSHDLLRRPRRGVRRADRRPDRGRGRRAAHRDDLRHAQRQGGDRRRPARPRPRGYATAADDLGHDHRSLGAHAVGPDPRRVLAIDPPRRSR